MRMATPLNAGPWRADIRTLDSEAHRPTWSVMIPTYNCAATLGETLTSVLGQDPGLEHMQIEVVDDASDSDDPEAIVREVGGGRVQYFRQPHNVGVVKNFETCLQRSRGHYIHLLHGDDFVLDGFYDALRSGFESDPSVGAAFCRWMIVDQAGNVRTVAEPLQDHAGELADAAVRLAAEQHIVTPSIAVARDVYELLGGFDERLECAEDWEMWVRIAANWKVWYEPSLLAAYRSHPDSNTGRHHRLAEELRYTAMVIDMIGSYLPPDRAAAVVRTARRNYARTAMANARQFSAAGDREAARAHLRQALELSRSPRILLESAKLLPRVVGS
jgi:glycosyltransferase involved in cell wall biosynthesis